MANVAPIIKALEMLRQIGVGHGLPGEPTEEFHVAEAALEQFNRLRVARGNGMVTDVTDFYEKFGIPIKELPQLLDRETLRFRTARLVEELVEFADAHGAGDLAGAADALVDLIYIAIGTGLGMGLPWPEIWDAVHEANMKKELAKDASESRHRFKLDIVKPAGWKAPDLRTILVNRAVRVRLDKRRRGTDATRS